MMQQWCSIIAIIALLNAAGFLLQGCGGGSPTPRPTPAPTPGPAPPSPPRPLLPLQGVSYNPLPCSKKDAESQGACNRGGTPKPGIDFAQEGYSAMWGKDGRDDLGTLLRVGANAVRVDSALGLDSKTDHGAFLDRAQELGLHVMPGFHTQMLCPKFNCFEAWKSATIAGLEHGYKAKNGSDWHPAVTMLILADDPDGLNFGNVSKAVCCGGKDVCSNEAKCRVRAVLSAMDGVLMAEKEKGVKSNVMLTAAWSSDAKDSIDGKVKAGIGYFGFQDMLAGVANPGIAGYSLQSSNHDFEKAFKDRWVNSINSAAPWSFVQELVADKYVDLGFPPHKWFLAEFKAPNMASTQLTEDLKNMAAEGAKKGGYFMGAVVYQFQNDYTNPEPQLFGMFGLGDEKLDQTTDVCEDDVTTHVAHCAQWPAYCLQALDSENDRAHPVAEAWKGSADALHGQCTKLLSKASISNTVNSTNIDSRPTPPEQSGVRVVV